MIRIGEYRIRADQYCVIVERHFPPKEKADGTMSVERWGDARYYSTLAQATSAIGSAVVREALSADDVDSVFGLEEYVRVRLDQMTRWQTLTDPPQVAATPRADSRYGELEHPYGPEDGDQ